MRKKIIERTIKVSIIEFEDGTTIDQNIIAQWLYDEACEYEDTIGKTGNYTSSYMYFPSNNDKELEKILLKYDVIRQSPNHMYINEKVASGDTSYYKDYAYWLSDGYRNFLNKMEKLDEIEK